jgi:plastocyanin
VDSTLSGSPAEVHNAQASSPSGSSESSATAGGGQAEVKIDNFSFNPTPVTVKPGTTVTWMNGDDIPHNVESAQKKFSSPVLDTNQKFTFTFKDAGEYPYFCKLHPKMTGKIVVHG